MHAEPVPQPAPRNQRNTHTLVLFLIAINKLAEAALLLSVGLGLGHLLRHGVQDSLLQWARAVRVDPDNRYVHRLIGSATGMSRAKMEALRIGTLLYGLLFTVEGLGLLLKKHWAEYLTVISTAGFLPVEAWELIHKFSAAKTVVAVVNVLVVVYLLARLLGHEANHTSKAVMPEPAPNPAS